MTPITAASSSACLAAAGVRMAAEGALARRSRLFVSSPKALSAFRLSRFTPYMLHRASFSPVESQSEAGASACEPRANRKSEGSASACQPAANRKSGVGASACQAAQTEKVGPAAHAGPSDPGVGGVFHGTFRSAGWVLARPEIHASFPHPLR